MAKGLSFGIMASGVVIWQAGKMATYDALKAVAFEVLEVPSILERGYTGYEAYQNFSHEYRDIGERVGDRIEHLKDWWYNEDQCDNQCE